MATEQRELSGQFEAHLRGGEYRPPAGLRTVSLICLPNGDDFLPLDPTTPEGAWEAVALLYKAGIFPDSVAPNAPWSIENVTAAWLAAAEEWSKK